MESGRISIPTASANGSTLKAAGYDIFFDRSYGSVGLSTECGLLQVGGRWECRRFSFFAFSRTLDAAMIATVLLMMKVHPVLTFPAMTATFIAKLMGGVCDLRVSLPPGLPSRNFLL